MSRIEDRLATLDRRAPITGHGLRATDGGIAVL